MKITVWHCYHYGQYDTDVIVAETEEALMTKVREMLASIWDADEQGPIPEDWDALMEAYEEHWGGACYVDGWGCSELEIEKEQTND